MGLPENIIEALENRKLTLMHPIKFEIYYLHKFPSPVEGEHMLTKVVDHSFDTLDKAHYYIARLIEERRIENLQFTILPVITA